MPHTTSILVRALAGSALLLFPFTATAQTETEAPVSPATTSPAPGQTEGDAGPTGPEPESDTGKKKKKDKAEGDAPPPLEFSGRVFAVAGQTSTIIRTGPPPMDANVRGRLMDLQSARFGLKYDVAESISLNLELDFSGRPEVKDAYVQAKSKHLRGRAGHIKMPVSSLTLESPWRLPVVDRGTIQDILVNRMQIIGRRTGAIGAVRAKGSLDPELLVGAFQGSQLATDGDVEPLLPQRDQAYDSFSLFARATITPAGNEIGLVGGRITQKDGSGTELRHFWMGGADATIDIPFEGHGLRAWVEGITGSTWYLGPVGTAEFPAFTYWSARGILSWRLGGMAIGDGYVEPFVQYGRLDPTNDPDVPGTVSEMSVGVGVGYWRQARLTIAYENTTSDGDLPDTLFPGNQVVVDRKAVFIQAGAAF